MRTENPYFYKVPVNPEVRRDLLDRATAISEVDKDVKHFIVWLLGDLEISDQQALKVVNELPRIIDGRDYN